MPKSYGSRRKERKPAGFRIFSPRTKGLMRVGVYLMVVLTVSSVFAGRSAMAGISEKALVTGRQLDKLQEFASGAERLMLNGQAINIGSATSTLSMEDVLDRFEAVCKADSTLSHDFREVDALLHDEAMKTFAANRNFGVIREQTADDGVVACATRNPENGNRTTLDGFRKFAESWDVADVGLLRYAYVRRLENGRSHVLTVWTDGSFKLDAMLPGDDGQDALGTDPENVPRPPSSTRYLTAAAEGRPHSVRIYESRQPAPEVLRMYETEMPKRGWTPIDTGDSAPEARYFERNGVDMLIVVEENSDRSMVSMVETGG